jgi:hypothetical protein
MSHLDRQSRVGPDGIARRDGMLAIVAMDQRNPQTVE